MAENEEDIDVTDEDELEPSGGNAGKKWLIAMLVLLLLAGGAAGGYYFLTSQGEDVSAKQDQVKEGGGESSAGGDGKQASGDKAAGEPVFYELPQFLVNLNTGGPKARFLKMTVTVELSHEEDLKVIEGYQPRIVDSVNTYLRELRASDLSGSAGLHRLREELMKRINQYISPAEVKNILFTEIVVQ